MVIILATSCTVAYWHSRKSFTKWVFAYSLLAYALAIAIKTVFQALTIGYVINSGPYALGIYYGLQTSLFEVGLAYLFAKYAVKKYQMSAKDASGYGVGLAFWENGILLGIIPLINLFGIYFLLSGSIPASSAIAAKVFAIISKSEPSLFLPYLKAFPIILLGLLERVSSILIHISWGFLAFYAAFYKKRKYLAIAMPMGLVDFFVPFAGALGLFNFEILIFLISVVSIIISIAIYSSQNQKNSQRKAVSCRKRSKRDIPRP